MRWYAIGSITVFGIMSSGLGVSISLLIHNPLSWQFSIIGITAITGMYLTAKELLDIVSNLEHYKKKYELERLRGNNAIEESNFNNPQYQPPNVFEEPSKFPTR